jgi:hypothetical protein
MQCVGLAQSGSIKHAGRTDPGASECCENAGPVLDSEAVLQQGQRPRAVFCLARRTPAYRVLPECRPKSNLGGTGRVG